MARRLLGKAALLAICCLLIPAATDAQESTEAARAAYDRATRAFEAGDYATAAREYARADELSPHAVALRWALESATRANDAVLAMTLAERAHRAPGDAALASAAKAARERFAERVGAVLLRCAPGEACSALVDGSEAVVEQEQFVVPGEHTVEFRAGDATDRRWIEVRAGERLEVVGKRLIVPAPAPPLPAPVAPPEDEANGGMHPAWLVVGAGVTAALGGALVWSGIDTLNRHEEYLVSRDPAGFEAGRDAQLRTNILIGATAGAAAVTGLLAIFAVDWNDGAAELQASVGATGAIVGGRFR